MNLLTGVYLFSALIATVATSTGKSNNNAGTNAWDGITNYNIQSNCPQRPDATAIRVEKSKIVQALRSNGTLDTRPTFDFISYGFPVRKIIMGVDQNGAANTVNQKCIVRGKRTQVDPLYDKSQKKYWFIEEGKLTTVIYDCYNGSNLTCTTSFSEMSAGDLDGTNETSEEQKTPSHTDNSREE